jgi:hypothetical protein
MSRAVEITNLEYMVNTNAGLIGTPVTAAAANVFSEIETPSASGAT